MKNLLVILLVLMGLSINAQLPSEINVKDNEPDSEMTLVKVTKVSYTTFNLSNGMVIVSQGYIEDQMKIFSVYRAGKYVGRLVEIIGREDINLFVFVEE